MTKSINNQTMNITIPALFETTGYRPAPLCRKAVYCWCMQAEDEIRKALANNDEAHESEKIMSLPQICVALGHNRQNAYHWQRKPGWKEWFHKAVLETIDNEFLPRVHLSLSRQATQTKDSSMVKLFLERFDKKYKPTTAQELKHSLPGYLPKETTAELAARSRARHDKEYEKIEAELDAEDAARKKVESHIVDEPAASQEQIDLAEKMEL